MSIHALYVTASQLPSARGSRNSSGACLGEMGERSTWRPAVLVSQDRWCAGACLLLRRKAPVAVNRPLPDLTGRGRHCRGGARCGRASACSISTPHSSAGLILCRSTLLAVTLATISRQLSSLRESLSALAIPLARSCSTGW